MQIRARLGAIQIVALLLIKIYFVPTELDKEDSISLLPTFRLYEALSPSGTKYW
jgi:hypothetical protein